MLFLMQSYALHGGHPIPLRLEDLWTRTERIPEEDDDDLLLAVWFMYMRQTHE